MKRKDFVPLVLWFILFSGIVVLAFIWPGNMRRGSAAYPVGLDTLFVVLYLLWMLMELPVNRRDVNTEDKQTSDSGTCQLYATGQALTILSALWFCSFWSAPSLAHFLGIGIFLFGVCYRLWAIRTLGEFYSHRVRISTDHQIVVSGPYRFTRHPAYAGMLVANAGICLYFFNYVTTLIFLLILVPSIILRIVVEERTLFQIAGYRKFAESRKRLLPAVW